MSDDEPENKRSLSHCPECVRLLEAYVSAVRATPHVLEAKDRSARAGIIDDLDFLGNETDVDQALTKQERAREAYARHRRERHGPAAR